MTSDDDVRAAVALIHVDDPEPSVLLLRRAERDDDPWSGQWALPGGRRNDGESLLGCARRECAEEVGIHPPAEPTAVLPVAIAGRAVGAPVPVAIFRWHLEQRPASLQLDATEVAAVHWLPCRLLAEDALHEQRAMAPRHPELRFPCLPFAEPPLWGFTYRVLRAWWCGLPVGE